LAQAMRAARRLGAAALPAVPLAFGQPTWAEQRQVPVVNTLPLGVTDKSFTLYQYESCPFCRKVRAALDYCDVPYSIKEVHPLTKKETRDFAPDYKKVPVLTVAAGEEEMQLRDSHVIVNALLSSKGLVRSATVAPRETPGTAAMWAAGAVAEAEDLDARWVLWADKVLVQLVVLNIYRSIDEAKETFSYLLTHPDFTAFEKYSTYWSGVVVMRAIAARRTTKYAVEDPRQAFLDAVDMVAAAVEAGKAPFIGGEAPSAADLNVFGILRSIESFTTEKFMFERSRIGPWYTRMVERTGPTTQGLGAQVRAEVRAGQLGVPNLV